MKSKREFYRTSITVDVLSEEPIGSNWSLVDIAQGMIQGDFSGIWRKAPAVTVTSTEAISILRDQGAEPGFFRLTEDGEDEE